MIEKYNRQRGEAGALLETYHAHLDEGGDQTRADELRAQYETAFKAATLTKEQADELRRLNDMGDLTIAREDTSFGLDTRDRTGRDNADGQERLRDLSPPSVAVMHRRQDILEDMMVGYQPREGELVAACRVDPVERLFPRVLLHRRDPMAAGLSSDELGAWTEYDKRTREVMQTRAVTGSFNVTANTGGDFIPTFLAPRIYSAIQFLGPLAGDSLVTVFTAPGSSSGGKVTMDIPTATNVVAAASKAINADATQETGATGAESLSTLNYTKLVNVPSEILLGSWVNFESWVMRSVVEAFGLAFNADRTRGSGASKIGGAFHASAYNATNSVTQASNAAITEAELSSLVALLGTGYHSRPNTQDHVLEGDGAVSRPSAIVRRAAVSVPDADARGTGRDDGKAGASGRDRLRGQRFHAGARCGQPHDRRHRRLQLVRGAVRRDDARCAEPRRAVGPVGDGLVLADGRRADHRRCVQDAEVQLRAAVR